MKVYLGKYRNHWVSPYKIIEKVVWWKDWENYEAPWVDKVADILHYPCVAANTTLDYFFPRKHKVRIDPWDTWEMYTELAHIILPMLKQLQETKHGAPYTDDEDVPDNLKSTTAPPKKNDWDTDDNHFLRWDYILSEMIWAFNSIVNADEYEDSFWVVKGGGMYTEKREDGLGYDIKWKEEPVLDKEKHDAHYKRQDNGLRLFGKYYRNLWD